MYDALQFTRDWVAEQVLLQPASDGEAILAIPPLRLSPPAEDGVDCDSMRPLDCADAFQYGYANGRGAYRKIESAAYADPRVAHQTLEELSRHYHQASCTAWKGAEEMLPSEGERSAVPPAPAPPSSLPPITRDDGEVVRVPEPELFVSLADEVRLHCLRMRGHPLVCWRGIDRVTAVEVVKGSKATLGPPTTYKSIYYLGPQQYMTATVWWTKVEAFAFGLRALGLQSGDKIGILEDTRWEWLVTCYAAWCIGLVVVVLHDHNRCMRQAALETRFEMKAIICKSSVHHTLRRLYREVLLLTSAAETPNPNLYTKSSAGAPIPGSPVTYRDQLQSSPRTGSGAASAALPFFISFRSPLPVESEEPQPTEVVPPPHGSGEADPPQQQRCSPTDPRVSPPHHADREEEEPLWWSDVLLHGEAKLVAWRQRLSRDRRQQRLKRQQQQLRHREQHLAYHSVQQQRGGGPPTAYSPEESQLSAPASAPPGVATATTTDLGVTLSTLTTAATAPVTAPHPCSSSSQVYLPSSLPKFTPATSSVQGPMKKSRQTTPLQQRGRAGGITPASASAALLTGGRHPAVFSLATLHPDDVAFIYYTEGDPHGVVLTHGAVKASVKGWQEYFVDTGLWADGAASPATAEATASSALAGATASSLSASSPWHLTETLAQRWVPALRSRTAPAGRSSYMAYLPLHQAAEFVAETALLLRGVLLCYGSATTLFDTWARPHGDLAEYKPTVLPAVPSLLAHLHDAVRRNLTTGYRKLLFDAAYEARRQAIRRGLQTPFLLSTVLAQPRSLLGGRCRLILCGGAPLHPCDQEYMEVVCGVSVVQVYVATSAGGCGLAQPYCSGQLGNVGGPLGPLQVKLRDVEGWSHHGERPMGELLLRGPTIMSGYHNQPEKTMEVMEAGGWLHTGDIAERCPDGSFRIIASLDPRRAKTSSGHCIATETLEEIYGSHPLCVNGGVCVLVHPYRPYIAAVVLSDEQRSSAFLAKAFSSGQLAANLEQMSWPHYLRDPDFNAAAAASLREWAAARGAAPYELVRRVRVLYDTWSIQTGTRVATGRLRRGAIHRRYAELIGELFTEV